MVGRASFCCAVIEFTHESLLACTYSVPRRGPWLTSTSNKRKKSQAIRGPGTDIENCACAEDEKENVDDKGKKPMREEDLPQAQDAEEEEEGDDSPGNRTDMELAWENLEVAKLIYERENAASYAKEIAGKQFPVRVIVGL